jgi:RimJ/RimL family protein N-acetyltransferase
MLRGELVTLRAIEPSDYPTLTDFANDVELELLGGGDPPSPHTAAQVAEWQDKMRDDKSAFTFAIAANGTDGLIGHCGLFNLDPIGRTMELGIGIGKHEYLGRGYGREAVAMLSDYAFTMRNVRKVHLSVHATNERAIRAYEAVGFLVEGRLREHAWSNGRYVDVILMAKFAPTS